MGRKQKSKGRNKSKSGDTPKSPADSVYSEDSSAVHQLNENYVSTSAASGSPRAEVRVRDVVFSQSSTIWEAQLSMSEQILKMLIIDWTNCEQRMRNLMSVYTTVFKSFVIIPGAGNTDFQKYRHSIRYFNEQFVELRKECEHVRALSESDNLSEPNTDLFLNGIPLIDDLHSFKEFFDELIIPYTFYEDLFSGAEPKWKAQELSWINSSANNSSPNRGAIQPQLIEKYPEMKVLRAFRWLHDLQFYIGKAKNLSSLKAGMALRFISESPPEAYQAELLNFVNKIAVQLKVLAKLRAVHQKLCGSVEAPKTENPIKDNNIDLQILILNEKARHLVLYWNLLLNYKEAILRLLDKAKKFLKEKLSLKSDRNVEKR